MLKGKSILVVGGAGFIGSHLVEEIISLKPKWLYVVDNLSLGKISNLESVKDRILFNKIEATNFVAMKQLMTTMKFDYVFNLAVAPLPESLIYPKEVIDININITTNLCELQRLGYIKTLIHFSSSEVYGSGKSEVMDESHPYGNTTPYTASKQSCDQICLSYVKTFNLDIRIIRPFNNYGPRQNDNQYAALIPIVIRRLQNKNHVVIHGDGEQTRDFIYVKDTVKAAIAIADEPKTKCMVINIGTGKETSVYKIVTSLLKLYGKDKSSIIYEKDRAADVRRHCADITLAKRMIYFTPSVSLKDGLKKTVEWYDKNK